MPAWLLPLPPGYQLYGKGPIVECVKDLAEMFPCMFHQGELACLRYRTAEGLLGPNQTLDILQSRMEGSTSGYNWLPGLWKGGNPYAVYAVHESCKYFDQIFLVPEIPTTSYEF